MKMELQRNYSIGSKWLYYKIYTGPKTADLVLTEVFKPISERLKQEGTIEKWFFIRYADPRHHLRVRFYCNEKTNVGKVISILYVPLNKFVEEDLIWKVQLDTYNREIERYGHNTMELSETLFCYDSDATVQFLNLIEGDEGEKLRWLFGIRSIDHLLECFSYTIEEKLNIMDALKTGFGEEFGMSRPLKKQLDSKYRKERSTIEGFMEFTSESEPDYEPILDIFNLKAKMFKSISEQILQIEKNNELNIELNSLMGSYIHMTMNRLFKSKNRLNEMVCYDFLHRHYKSKIARMKN